LSKPGAQREAVIHIYSTALAARPFGPPRNA
jgi:hypothetical protein